MTDISFELIIEIIAKQQKIWLLQAKDGLFAMIESVDNTSFLPIWYDKEMALSAITEEWEDYELADMDFAELISWLNELIEDQIMLGIVINDAMRIYPIDAKQMQALLLSLRKKAE